MQDAQPAQFQAPILEQQPSAEGEQSNPFLRHDTIFGVCEALGEDFGFNPLYLRLAFAGAFYFSPLWVFGTYLALGLVVALSRWLAPAQRPAAAPQLTTQSDAPQAANETIARPECLAA